MKKVSLFLSSALLLTTVSQAQISTFDSLKNQNSIKKNIDTVAWIHSANLVMGLNEGLLHNWAAGGELASLTVNGLFNGELTRYHHRSLWATRLNASYGLFYAYSNSFIPRKTDDRIDLTSQYGYRLNPNNNFYLVGLLNAKTQFTKAYNYDVPGWDTFSTSKFLSPLYITVAPGIEYRKGSQLSLFLSPLASRFTFVSKYYTSRDSQGAFGVKNGKTMRYELGAYFSGRYAVTITKNISYNTRVDLYSDYLAKDQVENGITIKKNSPGNIDVLWDNFLSIKFFKFFSLNFGLTAIYDNDVPYEKYYTDENGLQIPKDEPNEGLGWWQVKQVMTIGFNYKF
jgi:hypothetical protein